MNFSRKQPVRVQPYFGFRSETRLFLTARALHDREADFERRGRWRAFRTMLSQFASREAPNVPITLELRNLSGEKVHFPATTNSEGFATWELTREEAAPLPDETVWDVIALRWENRLGEQCVEGHVLAPGVNTRIAVISDIDDTIIETGITGGLRSLMRNWKRVLAQLPEDRIAVPGADVFYNSLGGGQVLGAEDAEAGDVIPAMHRPFFYVSSSPWNLYSYLVAFKRLRNLPLGPIMLRDWSFDRETLGGAGHGAHKRRSIDRICATYPELRFALIGDDTQGDLPAYAGVVADNPGRIAAVFIRTGAGEALNPEELAAKSVIEASGVPLWLGESYEIGQKFLAAAGLADSNEAAKIVEVARSDAPTEQAI